LKRERKPAQKDFYEFGLLALQTPRSGCFSSYEKHPDSILAMNIALKAAKVFAPLFSKSGLFLPDFLA
jgi:hypothetical protein